MSLYSLHVVIEGCSLVGDRATISTTVAVSAEEYAMGCYREEAFYRAGIRGLQAPLDIVSERIGLAYDAPFAEPRSLRLQRRVAVQA